MRDDELKRLWESCRKDIDSRDNADYELNAVQFRKLADAYSFFKGVAEDNGGRVERLKLVPREENGGVTAYFTIFYISDDDIMKFASIAKSMSALSIDATLDNEVCISFTIPHVFYKVR